MILTTVYTNTLFRPLGCHSQDIFATAHMKNYALRIVAISLYFNKLVTTFKFLFSILCLFKFATRLKLFLFAKAESRTRNLQTIQRQVSSVSDQPDPTLQTSNKNKFQITFHCEQKQWLWRIKMMTAIVKKPFAY